MDLVRLQRVLVASTEVTQVATTRLQQGGMLARAMCPLLCSPEALAVAVRSPVHAPHVLHLSRTHLLHGVVRLADPSSSEAIAVEDSGFVLIGAPCDDYLFIHVLIGICVLFQARVCWLCS